MKIITQLSLGRFVAIIVLVFAIPTFVFAGGDPIVKTNRLEGALGQLKKDSSVMVVDSSLINANYYADNKVVLSIDESSLRMIQGSFNASVAVHIEATLNNNYVVQYDTVLRVNYNDSTIYVREHAFFLQGAYKVKATITNVETNAGWDVWSLLKLTTEISSNIQYDFSCTLNAIDDISSESLAANTGKDELLVSWPNKTGADEYDLEWTYIDSSALISGMYGSPSTPSPDLIFKFNASRVSIKETFYKIPLIYDSRGHLFFRVRSVQISATGQRMAANWSQYSSGLGRFDYDGHERKLNWQATTTYAEEGKRKTVVQYFDGSLRNRQTVTKDNTSDSSTIVAETFYDLQGRPVIQVLPSPTLENVIKYNHHFNTGIGGTEYSTDMYDVLPDGSAICGISADSMSSSSGASRYYSRENPEKNTGMHRFIPDARKYPFTETQYTQDNTGRITKQGGVGPVHKITSGHETTYYYGTPSQEELDALFGTEVGHYSHYQKTAVKDANGQFSVSYLDMHGRTVATALAGIPSEAALDTLSSYTHETITETIADPSSAVIKDLIIESKKGLIVPRTALHTFTYELSPQSLQLEGCTQSICYDCLYDLRIAISGSCNNEAFGGQPFDTLVSNFSIGEVNGVCDAAGFSFSFTKLLKEGNYEITKQLSVSRYGLDYYRDSVFNLANTCLNFEDFVNEQRALLSNLPCAANCDSCKANVGSWENFREAYFLNAGITDTTGYTGQARRAYDEALAGCATLCDEVTEYDDIRTAMLSDMTAPSGQYANIDRVDDGYSIFYGSSPKYKQVTNYINEEGNIDQVYDESKEAVVSPGDLSIEEFASGFKQSWAEQLLPFHPEYCKLQLYETYVKPSVAWAKRFEKVDTYAEAVAKGYLNPSNKNTAPFNNFSTWSGAHPDPDPMASVLNFSLFVESGMINYRNSEGISVWEMAMGMVVCEEGASVSCYNNLTPFSSSYCDADKDMAWRNFRGMYLGLRKDFVDVLVSLSNCNGSTLANDLLTSGHQPHFAIATELLKMNGIERPTTQGEVDNLKAAQKARMNAHFDTTCRAYIPQWRKELDGCYDSATLDQIIEKMVLVCKNGADENHPFGASSIAPGSSYQYESFQEVLDGYSSGNMMCTADRITMPQPYNRQIIYTNKPVWSKPDSCECEKINAIYTQYQSEAANYSGFSDFMLKKLNTVMSDSVFNLLRDLCNENSGSCTFLKNPVSLPPIIQCYSGDICVNCEKITAAYSEFKLKYPGIRPTNSPADSNQVKNNTLFTNFFNNKFGFSKNVSDYIDFLASCNENPLETYSPYNLNKWMQDFKKYGGAPNLDAGGSDTTHWKINYSNSSNFVVPVKFRDVFQNGYATLPDTVQHNRNFNQINWDYYDDVCIDSSGFTFETRLKVPDSTLRAQEWYNSPLWIWLGSPYGPGPGSTIFSLNFNNKLGFCTHGNNGDPLKNCADYNSIVPYSAHFNDFRIIKAEIKNRVCKIFLDDTLLLEKSLDTPITKLSVWSILTFSGDAEIDYVRLYDTSGNYIFKEEFNNPDSLSIARSNCSNNCQDEFKDYFNQLANGNYSIHQIDSIYRKDANLTLNVCNINDECKRLDDILKNFSLDQNPNGAAPALQSNELVPPVYTRRNIMSEGMMRWPDSIRQRNDREWVYHQIVTSGTLFCLENGFSFETRVKNLRDVLNSVDDVIYITSANVGYVVYKQNVAPAGLYLRNINGNSDSGTLVDFFSGLALLDSNANAHLDWMTLKITVTPTQFKFYYNGVLKKEVARTSTYPLLNGFGFTNSFIGYQGAMDWVKIYDSNGIVQYFEDFNDSTRRAQPNSSFICPQPIVTCDSAFVAYFNQQNGSNYIFSEIDSIYFKTCGKHISICKDQSTACNSMNELVNNFKYNNDPKSVNWTFETKKAVIQRSDCVKQGYFHLPDQYSISPYGNSPLYDPNDVSGSVATRATFRLKDTTRNFCLSNGYTIETRVKQPQNLKGKSGYDVGISVFHNDGSRIYGDFEIYGANGVIFGDFAEGGVYADPNDTPIPSITNGFDEWRTIKFTIRPDKYLIYLDGVLIYSANRNAAIPIKPFYGGYIGFFGYDGYTDYLVIKDDLDKLVYREDFNDPYISTKPDLSRICPAGNDCTTDFANYYNSINSTSYSYNQIDSISLASCGEHLDVCEDTPPTLNCNDQQQLINDFVNGVNKGTNSCNGELWYQLSTIRSDGSSVPSRPDSGYIHVNRLDTLLSAGIAFIKDIPNEPDTIKALATDLQICNLNNAFVYEIRIKIPSYSFNYSGLRIYGLHLTTDKTKLSFTVANQSGWSSYNYVNTSPSSFVGNESISYIANLDNWNTVKVVAKDNKFKIYINDSLIRETVATAVTFDKIIGINNHWNYGNNGAIDYVRIYNGSGQLVYNEEFEDCSQMSLPLPANDCSNQNLSCTEAFAQYYNHKRGTNLSFPEIDMLNYNSCGYHIDVCTPAIDSLNGPTLCGNNTAILPPVDINTITNCSDSSFFIYSAATELYKVYTDSLYSDFDARYRSKCLDAYKMETFTVSHEVSEYHYTLYYYDQAGNLVKTVPPKGVVVNRSSLWLDDVKAKRAARETVAFAHSLNTDYRYNTLNQVVAQKTPDAGMSEFWYDRLGRLVMSQNALQKAASETPVNRLYSYTLYDQLGRITEVGQIKDDIGVPVDDALTRNQSSLNAWLTNRDSKKEQITSTVYDEPYFNFPTNDNRLIIQQRNLRNRVSYTAYKKSTGVVFNQATFYSYDIHGNVDTLLQDYGESWSVANIMNANGNRFKKIVYDYDLISGKVNKVAYQPGWADQFFHKYSYDAENRLTKVETSSDNKTWEQDANYEYYRHGPLARMVLGQQQVQGLDYAYTLQGWLKGLNSTTLTSARDMGGDGLALGSNQYVARDAVGFNLNYYDTSDYSSIGDVNLFPGIYAYMPSQYYRPLFNGNISSMVVNNRLLNGAGNIGGPLMLYSYQYDQLNRLTKMDAFNTPFYTSNSWAALTALQQFKEQLTYDGNGNILTLRRHAHKGAYVMDLLTYNYYANSNQLSRVTDLTPANRYGGDPGDVPDIDSQPVDNYGYDKIGNLVKDSAEGITNIKWSVYGKILEINKKPAGSNSVNKILYSYDAQGNRISKALFRSNGTVSYTWYVRDAQGNTLATYQSSGTNTISQLGSFPLSVTERHLYGSSRLGINSQQVDVDNGPLSMQYVQAFKQHRGYKQYELSNHLGNVLATITDKKKGVDGNTDGIVDYFDADVTTAQDYYPFGMLMPGRIGYRGESGWVSQPGEDDEGGNSIPDVVAFDSRENNAPPEYKATSSIELNPGFESGAGDAFLAYISEAEQGGSSGSGNNSSLSNGYYRYGFNGKEMDSDVKGSGNQYDYGFRIYDPRVGKFLSVDPLTNKYPELSPYQFASNMPIMAIDLDGEEANVVTVYHSARSGKEIFRTESKGSIFESFLNTTLTIHKYPQKGLNGMEWKQIGPAELSFTKPVNFQTGRIDLIDQTLGKLSEKYESRGPGTVSTGIGDAGGVSYGSWQLASKRNRPTEFLENEGSQWASEFGDNNPGTKEFSKIWRTIAKRDNEDFQKAQHGYIKRTHFDVTAKKIKSDLNLDINSRTSVLRDVVWSTSVQHGPGNKIFQNALLGKDINKLTDAEIIELVYAERGRENQDGNLVHFSRNSASVQRGVKNRFKKEMADALKQLQPKK